MEKLTLVRNKELHELVLKLLEHSSRYKVGDPKWWYWWNHYIKLSNWLNKQALEDV